MGSETDVVSIHNNIPPKGTLIAVGGNEDKEHDLTVLRCIVELVKKPDPHVEIITTASSIPNKRGAEYISAFEKIGVKDARLMHIRNREHAENPDFVERVKEANIIFFTGGDQLKITSIMGGSTVLMTIAHRYFHEECIIAGTSAGATAMSDTMIYGGESEEALTKGAVQMTCGVGLIKRVVIDSHFIKRGRFSRLMEVVTSSPGYIGVGLGEDTGIIIRKGHILEAIGKGLVVIFDGQHIKYSNVSSLKNGEAIAVEGVMVHTLVKGHGYDTMMRKYLRPTDLRKLKKG